MGAESKLSRPRQEHMPCLAAGSVEQRIRAVVSRKLGVGVRLIPCEMPLRVLGADSLDSVLIVLALEDEFCIDIPLVDAEEFRCLDDVVSFVERAQQLAKRDKRNRRRSNRRGLAMPDDGGFAQPRPFRQGVYYWSSASSDSLYRQKELMQVRELLESMLALEQTTLTSIARRLKVSKDRLKRTIYKHGWSYSRLREHVQYQVCTGLLERSDLSIEEICARTGYSEISCFYRAFRRWTGDTPGAYRESVRRCR